MLDKYFSSLIETWQLGIVATTDADGSPNIWPKDNFIIHDEMTIGFPETQTRGTLVNLSERPEIEAIFVDQLNQYGVRLRGTARVVHAGDTEFPKQVRPYLNKSPALAGDIKAIVLITLTNVTPTRTLAVEMEADLRERRKASMDRIRDINIKYFAAEKSEC